MICIKTCHKHNRLPDRYSLQLLLLNSSMIQPSVHADFTDHWAVVAYLDVVPDAEHGGGVAEARQEGEGDAGPGHEVGPANQEGRALPQNCQ